MWRGGQGLVPSSSCGITERRAQARTRKKGAHLSHHWWGASSMRPTELDKRCCSARLVALPVVVWPPLQWRLFLNSSMSPPRLVVAACLRAVGALGEQQTAGGIAAGSACLRVCACVHVQRGKGKRMIRRTCTNAHALRARTHTHTHTCLELRTHKHTRCARTHACTLIHVRHICARASPPPLGGRAWYSDMPVTLLIETYCTRLGLPSSGSVLP